MHSGKKKRPRVRLADRKQYSVHVLVLLAFIGPRPDGQEACHGDGNPLNNRLENLRWDTHLANEADKTIHGTRPVGERAGASVLTTSQVLAIRAEFAAGASHKSLSRKYGVVRRTVSKVVKRETWTHV
jgi:hypothetical protein